LQGDDGEGGWRGRDGWTWLDCLPCGSITSLETHRC
jgi:hypothetical protein